MEVVVRNSDGRVVLSLEPPQLSIVTLSEAQQAQLAAAQQQPNAGLRLVNGDIEPIPVPVPQTASSGDFMRALFELGWKAQVEGAVAALEGEQGELARTLWTRAAIFERNNALVVLIATMIGKTSEDLDDLFILANSYN